MVDLSIPLTPLLLFGVGLSIWSSFRFFCLSRLALKRLMLLSVLVKSSTCCCASSVVAWVATFVIVSSSISFFSSSVFVTVSKCASRWSTYLFSVCLVVVLKSCFTELNSAIKAEHCTPILSPLGVFSASLQEHMKEPWDLAFARATHVLL